MVVLHQPDGRPFYVRPQVIEIIRIPGRNEFITGTNAVIYVGGKERAVTETPEEIAKIVGQHVDAAEG